MMKGNINNKNMFADLNDIVDVDKAKEKMKDLESELSGLAGQIKDENLRKSIFETFEEAKKGKITAEEVKNKFNQWQQKFK